MRDATKTVLAAGALALALLAAGPSAHAFTLPAPKGLAAARDELNVVTQVRTVCEKQWDGYQWTERCRTVGQRYSLRSRLRSLERRTLRYLRYW